MKNFVAPEFKFKKRFSEKHPKICYYGNFVIYHFQTLMYVGILFYCIGNVFFFSTATASQIGNGSGFQITLSAGQINQYAVNVTYLALFSYLLLFVIKYRNNYSSTTSSVAIVMFSFMLIFEIIRAVVINYGHFDFNPVARNIDSSGHDIVYAGIFAYALIVRLYQKMNVKGFLVSIGLVMFTVAICECMFNLAYYIFLVPDNHLRALVAMAGIGTYGNLALLLVSLGVPAYFLIWRMLNQFWFRISVLSFFLFLIYWIVIGFPITINSVIGETQFYPLFIPNLREIVSWLVYLIPATIAYVKGSHEYKENVAF